MVAAVTEVHYGSGGGGSGTCVMLGDRAGAPAAAVTAAGVAATGARSNGTLRDRVKTPPHKTGG